MAYYILSLKWTRKREPYVSFWRPNNAGYCWPLEWAGVYTSEQIADAPRYYNDGENTLAVPVGVVEGLTVIDHKGKADPVSRLTGQRGRCVPFTAKNMGILRAAALPTQPVESLNAAE